MAYEGTEVAVSKSQEQIRTILRRYEASTVNFGERFEPDGSAEVGVEFVYESTLVRMLAHIATPDPEEVEAKARRSRAKTEEQIRVEMGEQEARRMWRVLHWAIEVRMEAVAEGLETFEQSFLAHLVDPGIGRTIWDHVSGSIEGGAMRVGEGSGLLALTAGAKR